MKMKLQHKDNQHNRICVGTGLVALDVVISSNQNIPAKFLAGGSCGNVLMILAYFGWESYPIARLSNNVAGEVLLEDLKKWNVKDDLISCTKDGSTPVIIHRILKDREGKPKHRFEFKNPENGSYLPSYKPFLSKKVSEVTEKIDVASVFYFDRMNRAAIDLAMKYRERSGIIVFEPSSSKDERLFSQSLEVANIVKFSSDRIVDFDTRFPVAVADLEIQTLGVDGLKFRTKGDVDWISLPSFVIEDVVDSAGAGDWCTAGLLQLLINLPTSQWTKNEIIKAIQYGQVLSALNCTFEGARGLMENIESKDLLHMVNNIVSTHTMKIPNQNHAKLSPKREVFLKDISSLFTEV